MISINPTYSAKILLFGEYSILLGSSALSMPFNHFKAEFNFIKENKNGLQVYADKSRKQLINLLNYLKKSAYFSEILDLNRFAVEIDEGIYFQSSIPQSYGLGSSGAVIAAVYSRYKSEKNVLEMNELLKIFSEMEAFFHGTSSGIDPLTIYNNEVLLINNDKKALTAEIPFNFNDDIMSVFLIDTGESGKTIPLVHDFLKKYSQNGKINTEASDLVSLTNQCIQHLLNDEVKEFLKSLKALSVFQLKNMQYLIPEKMKNIWKNGLETNSLYMKLCGSGGGGYLLAFASEKTKAEEFIKYSNLKTLAVFFSN